MNMKKLKQHSQLSVLMIMIGIAGIIIVGYVDDEPILLNPLLIVIGIGWYLITRKRIRSNGKTHNTSDSLR
jgi:uncharacterized membrane protein YfcA